MNTLKPGSILLWLLLALGLLAGCAGTYSFPNRARANETISLQLGWHPNISRQDVTVTITDSASVQRVFQPGSARVVALYNVYPDPASNMVVGVQTNQNMGNNEHFMPGLISSSTGGDTEWSQTMMLLNLPVSMATGPATISVSGPGGPLTDPINIEIEPGQGNPTVFESQANGNVPPRTMERAPHYTVSFSGSVIPHSMQVTLAHTPGVGTTWVTFPRGDLMSAGWSDTGSLITIILSPTKGMSAGSMSAFKFYVAGGVTGLTLNNLKAYDVNGNLMAGVSTTIQ